MKANDILAIREHRPFELAAGEWKWFQRWEQVYFLHWKVPSETVQAMLPDSLVVEEIDDSAWISVVMFDMVGAKYRGFPPFKPLSNFGEVNIRTYVSCNGVPGVYFLKIFGGKKLSNLIARMTSGLPYENSHFITKGNVVKVIQMKPRQSFLLDGIVGNKIDHLTEIDRFLTDRYCLYDDRKTGQMQRFHVHHKPWVIRSLRVDDLHNNLIDYRPLLDGDPDLTHYSNGVDVLVWDGEAV